jgi:hypothetical protein
MQGIVITFFISLVFALIGFMAGQKPVVWFGLSFIGQFILSYLWNRALLVYKQIEFNRLEVTRLNAMEKNRTTVECAVCKSPNVVDVLINEPNNEFRCEHCQQLNSVYVSIKTAQKTEMVNGIITDELAKRLIKENDIKSSIPDSTTQRG